MARRLAAGPEGPVLELEALTGDAYEAWVADLDPDSAEPARAAARRRRWGAVR